MTKLITMHAHCTKLTAVLFLSVALTSSHARAQGRSCTDRFIESSQASLSLVEANAEALENSAKTLREACTTEKCTDLATYIEKIAKIDRDTAKSMRSAIADLIKAR
jgi:uncharacterized alpha-E superfamily protein